MGGIIDSNYVNGKIKSKQTNLTNESTDINGNYNTDQLEVKGTPSAFVLEIKGTTEPTEQSNNVDKKLGTAIFNLKGSTESFMFNEEIKVEGQEANETTNLIEVNNKLNVALSSLKGISESTQANNALRALASEVIGTTESPKFNDVLKPEVLVEVNETTESILDNLKSEMLEVKGTNDSNNFDEHFKSMMSNLNGSSESTVVNGKVEAFEFEVKGTTELNTETEKLRKMAHPLEVDSISKITENNDKLKEVVSDINENTASRVVNEKCKAFIPEATGATQSTDETTENLKTVADVLVVNGSSELTENNGKVKTAFPDFKANVASTVINGQFRAFVPDVKETTEPTVENDAFKTVAELFKVNGTTELTENIEKVKTVLSDLKGTTKSSAVDAMFKLFVPEVMGTSESTAALNVLTGSAEKFKSTGFDLKRTTESIVRNENQLKTEIASYLEFKGTTASSVVHQKPKAETFELNKNTDLIKPIKKVKTAMMIDLTKPTGGTLNNEKANEVVLEVHGNPLKTLIIDFKSSTESPIFNMKPKAVMSEMGRLPESDEPNEKHKTVFIQLKETIKTTKNNKKFERILSAVKETTESTLVHEKTKTLVSELNKNPGSFDLYEKHKAVFIELKGTTKPTKAGGKLDTELLAANKTTESTLVNDKTKTIVSELNKKPESIELNKKQKTVLIKLNGATPSKVNASLNALLSAIGVTSEAPLVNEKLKLKVSELSKHPELFEVNEHPKAVVIELKGVTKPTQINGIINAIASAIRGTTEATLVSETPKSVTPELNKESDQKTESFDINEKLKTVLNEMIGDSKDAKVNEMLNAVVSVLRGSAESTSDNNPNASPPEINVKPESIDVNEKLKLLVTELKATTESSLLNDELKSGVNKSSDGTNPVTNALECKQNLKTFKDIKITNETNVESKKPLTLFLSRLEGTIGATTAQYKSNNEVLELTEKLKSSSTIEKKPIKLVPNVKSKLESSILNKTPKPVISDILTKSSVPNAESNNLSAPHQNKNLKFSMVKKKNKISTLQPKENLTSNAVLQSGDFKSLNHCKNPKTTPLVNYHDVHPVLNDKSTAMSSVGKTKFKSSLANSKPGMNITDSTLINGNHSQIESNFKTMSSESSGKALSNMLGNKSATTISKERVSIKDIENIKLNTAVSKLKDNTKLNISIVNFKTVKGKPESPRTITNKNTKTTPQMLLQNLIHKSNVLKENSQMTVLKQKEKYKSTKINKKQPTGNFHSNINHVHLQNLSSNQNECISTTTKYIPLERISKSVLPNLVSKSELLKNDLNLVNSKFNGIKSELNFKSNLNTTGSEKHKRSVNKMSVGGEKCISKDEEIRDYIDKKTVKKVIDDLINEIDSNESAIPSKPVSSNTIDWNDLIKLSEQMKDTHSFDMANILKCLSDIINEAIKKSESNNDSDPPNECKEKIEKNKL